MITLLCVAAGGAIGTSARYLTGIGVGQLLGLDGFPYGTLIVNVLGCFIMGLLIGAMALFWSVGNDLRAFLIVGILGGFTTFSSVMLDTFTLGHGGDHALAFWNVVLQTAFGLAAVWAGYKLGIAVG